MKVGLLIKPWIAQQAGIHQFTRQLASALAEHGRQDYYLVGSEPVESDLPQLTIPAYAESYVDPRRWLMGARLPELDWIIDPSHLGAFGLFPEAKKCTIIHDLTPIYFPEYHRLTSVIGHKLLLKRALNQSVAVIAISQQTQADLGRFLGRDASQKVHQIYPGFAPASSEMEKVELPGSRFFLSVGTAEPRKNLGGLIQAFERFAQEDDETLLVFAGPEGWKESLKDRIAASTVAHRMVNLGFVKPERLQWLYANALALTYVSMYEGFGFPILEAMSAGCPVITSDLGSMKELANSHALTIDPNSMNAIAEAMKRLFNDEQLRTELIQKGVERQKAFDWAHFVAALEERCFKG